MTTDQAIGERVHREMWRQRTTQTRLAEKLGITQTAVSRKIRGERPWFATEVVAVADALGVSVAALYGLKGDDWPEPDPGQAINSGWTSPSRRAVMALVSSPQVIARVLAAA